MHVWTIELYNTRLHLKKTIINMTNTIVYKTNIIIDPKGMGKNRPIITIIN